MKIHITHMVSPRCKMAVKDELKKLGIGYGCIELGTVEVAEDLSPKQREVLNGNLLRFGLELIDDKNKILVEKIKCAVIEMVHYREEKFKINFSYYIAEKLACEYNHLSNVFSEVTGITISQFIIKNKIEKVKELLLYDELSLSEISYKMHYNGIAHLSKQFKKTTGCTPSFFKKMKQKRECLGSL